MVVDIIKVGGIEGAHCIRTPDIGCRIRRTHIDIDIVQYQLKRFLRFLTVPRRVLAAR